MNSTSVGDAPLLRLTVHPTPENGLEKISQIQAYRILTLPTKMLGKRIGHLSEDAIKALNRMLAIVIGLG